MKSEWKNLAVACWSTSRKASSHSEQESHEV